MGAGVGSLRGEMIRIACAGAIGKFAESVSANAGGRLGWIMAVSALQSEVRRPQENLKMGGASRRNVRMPGAWEDEGVDARNKAFQIGMPQGDRTGGGMSGQEGEGR